MQRVREEPLRANSSAVAVQTQTRTREAYLHPPNLPRLTFKGRRAFVIGIEKEQHQVPITPPPSVTTPSPRPIPPTPIASKKRKFEESDDSAVQHPETKLPKLGMFILGSQFMPGTTEHKREQRLSDLELQEAAWTQFCERAKPEKELDWHQEREIDRANRSFGRNVIFEESADGDTAEPDESVDPFDREDTFDGEDDRATANSRESTLEVVDEHAPDDEFQPPEKKISRHAILGSTTLRDVATYCGLSVPHNSDSGDDHPNPKRMVTQRKVSSSSPMSKEAIREELLLIQRTKDKHKPSSMIKLQKTQPSSRHKVAKIPIEEALEKTKR